MSFAANIFGRDSAIFKVGNVLGLGIPGWLDKKFGAPETEGPRLSDLAVQTSTYGTAIPRVYGTIAFAGNVIWLEGGKLREVVKKNKRGGKGGGSTEPDKTYTYFATFHLALCEGPIAGVRRIWCSDKLIYDAGSDDLETIIASNSFKTSFVIHRGTDDQMPDPRYEADVGVENASAHRGLAYISFYDWNLTDYGNTLEGAQFKVEVVQSASLTGIRKLVDVASGTNYSAAPYIFNSGALNSATLGFSGKDYASSGALIRSYLPDTDDVMPADTGGFSNIGKVDGEFVTVKISNLPYVNGVDIARLTSAGFHETVSLGIAGIGSKKVMSMTVTSDGSHSIIFLVDASKNIFTGNSGTWHVLNIDFDEIDSGEFYNESPYIGVGVVARYHFGAIVLSDDLRTLYKVYGAGDRNVSAIDLETFVEATLSQAIISAGAFSRPSLRHSDGILTILAKDRFFQFATSDNVSSDSPLVSDVLTAEISLSALIGPGDVDTYGIISTVQGYQISGGSIRSALEPLATAFQFDVIQSGYKIKFVPRGGASVLAVPYEDLGATAGDTPDSVFSPSREMDTQLPAKTTVSYLDAPREYEVSEQSAARINTEAVNEEDVELAIVLGADEAAGIAEILQNRAWLERTSMSLTLPPIYLGLEPTDVITVDAKTAIHEIVIREIDYTEDGRLEIKGVPSNAAIYTPNASGGEGELPPSTIGLPGPSLFLPLDIPLVDEISQNAPGFVGVMTGYTTGWPGATAFRSNDEGQTWTDVQGYTGKAGIGTASGTLAINDGYLIDQSSLSVLMISGEPESITRDQLLTGYNYAAYGVDGRWEVVRFQNAELQADGSYTLSGFVRGDKGTEWATGLHQSGDWFVLLDDPDNAFIGMATASIGIDQLYRGITQRASIETGTNVEFSYDGVNLEPLSPVYAKATRDGSGNLSATFVRRSRLGSTWWGNGVEAPVGEATQAYQIDVMNGATVVRTIESATPAFTYSAADQVTDFGSAQSSILFRIYQISDLVDRGYVREVTL